MKKMTSNEIRNLWFEFWKNKGHEVIKSAPLIPDNDPTLLWINAGVTPLKKYFDGSVTPPNNRLTSIQKCIRTNDIENVGKTARHQTFFEMLGNFSIGDYFKKEAITWAYEFLIEYLKMDKDKLYITVYTDDTEAYNLWLDMGVDESHIIKLETNFWEIGPGPSGPDSEIFYDRGPSFDERGIELLEQDIENDRYVEIWNNVFSQYNAKEDLDRKDYPELPHKNIDTGMGLERICCIMQDVETNFDTDLFMPIIKKIEQLSNTTYHGEMAYKVIADHVRALTFALSDGASFGNTGRDYVLRRLLRRALRYARKLNIEGPFMSILVDEVVNTMKGAYPELVDNINTVKYKINQEEELFSRTLKTGEKRLEEIVNNSKDKKISGEDAFRLYDTYGFPFELTLEYANELGFSVSKDDFDKFMQEQQNTAKASRKKVSSMKNQNEHLLNFKEESTFNYDLDEINAKVIGIFDGDKFVESLDKEGYLVLDETVFYTESGGQVSDKGYIDDCEITDSFKGPNGQTFHYIKTDKPIKLNDTVTVKIDSEKRANTRKNHSSVHLVQKALQQILSGDIYQMGSYVDDKRFRFDFRYEYKISRKEIIEVEALVNEKINTKVDTKTDIMDIDDALKTGAMALFSDKYGKKVRVVTIADSKELCGGTHVKNVYDIKRFAIKSLESKGSNVYRVEGATDTNIEEVLFEAIKPYNDDMMKLLNKAKNLINDAKAHDIKLDVDVNLFNINNDEPHTYQDVLFNLDEVEKTKGIVATLDKKYQELRSEQAMNDLDEFEDQIRKINDINTLIVKLENYDNKALKKVVDTLENKHKPILIFMANITNDNVNYLAKASDTLSFNVGELVKIASNKSGGNGGGSKTFAQGGGTMTNDVDKVLQAIELVVLKNGEKD